MGFVVSKDILDACKERVRQLIEKADYHAAIETIEKTCIVDGEFYSDWQLELDYARCLIMVGRDAEAGKIADKSISFFENIDGYNNQRARLICILILLGRFEEAKTILNDIVSFLNDTSKFIIARAWLFNLQFVEARELLDGLDINELSSKRAKSVGTYLRNIDIYQNMDRDNKNSDLLPMQDYCCFRRNGKELKPGLIINCMPLRPELNIDNGWLGSEWRPHFKYLIFEIKDGNIYAFPWVPKYDSSRPVVSGTNYYDLFDDRQIKEPCVVIPIGDVTSVNGCLRDEDLKRVTEGACRSNPPSRPPYGFNHGSSAGQYVGPAHGSLAKKCNI